MKLRRSLLICGVLIALVAFISARLLRPSSAGTATGVSVYLLGYTNLSGTNMALFVVTNRTTAAFTCFVQSHARSVAWINGVPLFRDLSPGVTPGDLPPSGGFPFAVRSSADTNLWHVSVELVEVKASRPKWQRAPVSILRSIGVHSFDDRWHHITSPPFGNGEQ